MEQDGARFRRQHAKYNLRRFAPSRTDETRQADDLARAHGEGYILSQGRTVEIAHFQHNLADLRYLFGKEILDGAAHHHTDQFPFAGIFDILRADILAIAQDRYTIGQLEDFIESMTDVNDADAAFTQQPHNAE